MYIGLAINQCALSFDGSVEKRKSVDLWIVFFLELIFPFGYWFLFRSVITDRKFYESQDCTFYLSYGDKEPVGCHFLSIYTYADKIKPLKVARFHR